MAKRQLVYLFGPLAILLLVIFAGQGRTQLGSNDLNSDPQTTTDVTSANDTIVVKSIYWSDGDSGRINETLKFRLNDVDAPETGGVGAAIGGAKCEAERAKGYDSKAWVVDRTKNANLKITQTHGEDRHGRLIIDLSSDGQDVGQSGIKTGHYQAWPHDGSKSLSARPIWC